MVGVGAHLLEDQQGRDHGQKTPQDLLVHPPLLLLLLGIDGGLAHDGGRPSRPGKETRRSEQVVLEIIGRTGEQAEFGQLVGYQRG